MALSKAWSCQNGTLVVFGICKADLSGEALDNSTSVLSVVELFSGVGSAVRAARLKGHNAQGFDIYRVPDDTDQGLFYSPPATNMGTHQTYKTIFWFVRGGGRGAKEKYVHLHIAFNPFVSSPKFELCCMRLSQNPHMKKACQLH